MSALSKAARLIVGRLPGSPRQTGQVWVLGGLPKVSAEQPQNILLLVLRARWTSKPITGSSADIKYSLPIAHLAPDRARVKMNGCLPR